ncbi:NfeD family protein [Aestuariibacter halophilus]|uniref:NfeD family protein n=1 Tax=Fluctibacter halophilus TaxID=226011 RepID=A0ABS8GAS4_9ALTE|nr:NfeD family protein [Aestuariibacter halophilus]MCC2617684.1 NfeD family protein [Aestuariibacter halophilus]
MEWFTQDLPQHLVILGLALLAIEILILGFSTFVLFFVGVACIVVGALMYVQILPDTGLIAMASVAVLTALEAALLWKPLKRMQSQVDNKPAQNDMVGYHWRLEQDISPQQPGEHSYSGILWRVETQNSIPAGAVVRVDRVDVGVLFVSPQTQNDSQ